MPKSVVEHYHLASRTQRLDSPFLQRVENVGHRMLHRVEVLGDLLMLAAKVLRAGVSLSASQQRFVFRILRNQVFFTGCQAVMLVSWLALAAGALVVFYAGTEGSTLNSAQMSMRLLYLVAIKEVGPLVCALIVIARSGTAVASEIGAMKVNQELDALRAVGIEPQGFVLLPRVLGGVVSQLGLVAIFSFAALVGGFFASLVYQPMTLHFFFSTLAELLQASDFLIVGLKAFGTGTIVFLCACYYGAQVEKSSHEIPQVTTRAVVAAIGGVLFWCVLLSFLHLNLFWDRGVT